MHIIDLNGVNLIVLRKHHLTDDSKVDNVIKIVNDICGLHATGSTAPYLSLFARTCSFAKDILDEELFVKKNLGKIPCMRRTLQILTKEMIPIAYAATRKMAEKLSEKYLAFRDVSHKEYEELSNTILNLLKGNKEISVLEIKKFLRTELNVSAILYLMCDQGFLIRSSTFKYSLFNEHFPNMNLNKICEMEARMLLVQCYLRSFGPVIVNDIVLWTGFGKTEIQQALKKIQDQIINIRILNLKNDFIQLRSDGYLLEDMMLEKQTVNLLPILDSYLMGYKERQRLLNHEYYENVYDRSGKVMSTILLDGRVIRVWDFAEEEKPLVKIYLFDEFEKSILEKIFFRAHEVGRFIAEREVKIKRCNSMTPLPHRMAGAVMSPLKYC